MICRDQLGFGTRGGHATNRMGIWSHLSSWVVTQSFVLVVVSTSREACPLPTPPASPPFWMADAAASAAGAADAEVPLEMDSSLVALKVGTGVGGDAIRTEQSRHAITCELPEGRGRGRMRKRKAERQRSEAIQFPLPSSGMLTEHM